MNIGMVDVKQVTKFDGTNFQLWKFQVSTVLRAQGAIGYVDGTVPKPEVGANGYADWCKNNAIAMCTLSTAMEFHNGMPDYVRHGQRNVG